MPFSWVVDYITPVGENSVWVEVDFEFPFLAAAFWLAWLVRSPPPSISLLTPP
jgi:hypothetical protein